MAWWNPTGEGQSEVVTKYKSRRSGSWYSSPANRSQSLFAAPFEEIRTMPRETNPRCPKCGNPNYASSSQGEMFAEDALWVCDDIDCPATIDERDLTAVRQREADLLAENERLRAELAELKAGIKARG